MLHLNIIALGIFREICDPVENILPFALFSPLYFLLNQIRGIACNYGQHSY